MNKSRETKRSKNGICRVRVHCGKTDIDDNNIKTGYTQISEEGLYRVNYDKLQDEVIDEKEIYFTVPKDKVIIIHDNTIKIVNKDKKKATQKEQPKVFITELMQLSNNWNKFKSTL